MLSPTVLELSPDGNRSHDVLISKQMCYHCATEAGGFGENKKKDIFNLRIVYTEKMKINLELLACFDLYDLAGTQNVSNLSCFVVVHIGGL